MIDNIDARSSEIKKTFDDNKDLKKVVLERVIKVLNEARVKFDISKVLKSAAKHDIKEYDTYKSDELGVRDIVLPANAAYSFDN